MNNKFSFILTIFVLYLYKNEALAYLDPGTGSMILQVIIAAFVAVGIYIKLFWHKLKNIFIKKNKNNTVKKKK